MQQWLKSVCLVLLHEYVTYYDDITVYYAGGNGRHPLFRHPLFRHPLFRHPLFRHCHVSVQCAHISDITHPNPSFGGMVPLRMSSIVSAVALLDVGLYNYCISLYRPSIPHPLPCDIASQHVRFCSVNSGVLLRLRHRVRVWIRVRVRVSLLKFLIILAVTLPSCE